MDAVKNIKLFVIAFFLSIPFWLGINYFQRTVEGVFYAEEITNNPPYFFVAEISRNYPFDRAIENLSLSAESAVSVEAGEGQRGILFEKNADKKLAIASLTKLLSALVALDFYEPSMEIKISTRAVSQAEEIGYLKPGEILTVEDLLRIMLIESSNDAAFALAEPMSIKGFVSLMNLKAKEYGMENSYFYDPSGLDSDELQEEEPFNFSTARDLTKLTEKILEKPLLGEILSQENYPLFLKNGQLHHILKNTNKLLADEKVLFGKTGYTEKAGGCLLVVSKSSKPESYIINVVLNSRQRFEDMEKLIDAVQLQRQR